MTDPEYIATQKMILQVTSQISQLDLYSFIARINSAETVGPILDPTMYRDACGNLSALKRLAESLVEVQAAHFKVVEAVVDTWAVSERKKGVPL